MIEWNNEMIEGLKLAFTALAAMVGLFALIKALLEYRQRNMLNRIEIYLQMRDKYARQPELQKVCTALGDANTSISTLQYYEKRLFLGTMETVALMVQSNVINPYVAMYMFGYYAIAAWESDEFWGDGNLQRSDPMWSLYRSFVREMRRVRTNFQRNPEMRIKENLNFYKP